MQGYAVDGPIRKVPHMLACIHGYGIDAPIHTLSPMFDDIRKESHKLLVCLQVIPDVLGLFFVLNILPKVGATFFAPLRVSRCMLNKKC